MLTISELVIRRIFAYMHRFRFNIVAVAFLALTCPDTRAEAPPPPIPFNAITWEATLKTEPSRGVRLGSFYVHLERTTLDQIHKAASVGAIAHRGDASASAYWLCYTNVAGGAVERVWLVAHGEMGGREHFVTHVIAQQLSTGSATAECPSLPAKLTPVSLDRSLWLRSSSADLSKRLGAPSYRKQAWLSFDYEGKLPGNCEDGFDLISSLVARVVRGRVTSLQLSRVTSC